MAESKAHKLGQFIGNLVEKSVQYHLQKIADNNFLYFDKHGPREARKGKRKISWYDDLGNKHDLDLVLERNGTNEKIGEPVAFIECAWRRYTKHSRNKVQEIQGAILPLSRRYNEIKPFLGVLLVGEFTKDSIKQLESNGFSVLYYPYKTMIEAFSTVGIDIYWDEETTESNIEEILLKCSSLSEQQLCDVMKSLNSTNKHSLAHFLEKLELRINRKITKVTLSVIFQENIELTNELELNITHIKENIRLEEYIVSLEYTDESIIQKKCLNVDEVNKFIKEQNYMFK